MVFNILNKDIFLTQRRRFDPDDFYYSPGAVWSIFMMYFFGFKNLDLHSLPL